jgi:hypothetical protein
MFAFECYPEPMLSQQLKCANSVSSSLTSRVFCTTASPHPPWRFDLIPGNDFPWRGFAITLTGHTIVCRSPLDDDQPDGETCTWKYNIHKRQVSIPSAVFELTIPASERPQTPHLKSHGHWIDLYKRLTHQHSVWFFLPTWATCPTRPSVCCIPG